ncbi:Uncharacterized protein TCM_035385 [Theobroma cacao]|uniref:RNase H type-1 domain-containing protein n=1 Tax=Theobroma cacao TaxID=3641 RepID=A0A061FPX3_THECC|nr:Uncharacterized protein TCM_035385 [Theobroma cacao]
MGRKGEYCTTMTYEDQPRNRTQGKKWKKKARNVRGVKFDDTIDDMKQLDEVEAKKDKGKRPMYYGDVGSNFIHNERFVGECSNGLRYNLKEIAKMSEEVRVCLNRSKGNSRASRYTLGEQRKMIKEEIREILGNKAEEVKSREKGEDEVGSGSVSWVPQTMEEAKVTWNLSNELGVQYRVTKFETIKFLYEMERGKTNGERGLGRGEKKRALRKLLRIEKPSMVFIQETKIETVSRNLFSRLWNGEEIVGKVVEADGRSGGIISLWQKNFFELEVCKMERNFLMIIGRVKGIDAKCGFINIYAPNDEGKRRDLWIELSELMNNTKVWWILRGDFNTVRFEEERIGTGDVGRAAGHFDEFINITGVVDLSLTGAKFTWQVFGWEHKQYDSFNDTINEFFLCENMKDELVWKKTANGEFTVKSFCLNYVELRRENQREWKWVWGGYAPHKTETLVWQLMHEKAAVKGELVKRGIISATEVLCPLCKDSIETVDHLFVGCISVKSLWYAWCKEWGFAWVMPTRFKELMTMWNAINVKASCDKIWRMAVFAITWTIWIGRNEVVFHNKVWDKELIWELIKLRVATWADARWKSNSRSILDLYRYPVESYNQQKDRGQRPQTVWERPEEGMIKFNVDGAAIGCPGDAGIGGLLKNEKGETLIKFSKAISRGDSNLAEYLGIKEAFILFSNSIWANNYFLVIESDSRNAIKWINDPQKTPWRLRKWMLHIEVLKKRVKGWKARHTLREGNCEADQLAKERVGREIDLLEFFHPM